MVVQLLQEQSNLVGRILVYMDGQVRDYEYDLDEYTLSVLRLNIIYHYIISIV